MNQCMYVYICICSLVTVIRVHIQEWYGTKSVLLSANAVLPRTLISKILVRTILEGSTIATWLNAGAKTTMPSRRLGGDNPLKRDDAKAKRSHQQKWKDTSMLIIWYCNILYNIVNCICIVRCCSFCPVLSSVHVRSRKQIPGLCKPGKCCCKSFGTSWTWTCLCKQEGLYKKDDEQRPRH